MISKASGPYPDTELEGDKLDHTRGPRSPQPARGRHGRPDQSQPERGRSARCPALHPSLGSPRGADLSCLRQREEKGKETKGEAQGAQLGSGSERGGRGENGVFSSHASRADKQEVEDAKAGPEEAGTSVSILISLRWQSKVMTQGTGPVRGDQ